MSQAPPKQNDIPTGYVPLVAFCETHHLDICRMMTLYDRHRLKLKVFMLADDTPVYILRSSTVPPPYAYLTTQEKARNRRSKDQCSTFVKDGEVWTRPYSKSELARQLGVTKDQMRRFMRKTGLQDRIPKGKAGTTLPSIPPSLFNEALAIGKEYFASGQNKKQSRSKYEAETKGDK